MACWASIPVRSTANDLDCDKHRKSVRIAAGCDTEPMRRDRVLEVNHTQVLWQAGEQQARSEQAAKDELIRRRERRPSIADGPDRGAGATDPINRPTE
jgi:hypothetical protein